MKILIGINMVVFGLLGLAWSTNHYINYLLKFLFIILFIVNFIFVLYLDGYIVKIH